MGTLSIIVAMARNRAIGKDNQLLWHLSADLKRFKELTTGHTILMGRKTFESLPNGVLPNRRNVVVSRQNGFFAQGIEVYPAIEQALESIQTNEETFVIGGGTIYHELLPLADKLYITEVDSVFSEADTFFPEIDMTQWRCLHTESIGIDERNPLASTFSILERIKK